MFPRFAVAPFEHPKGWSRRFLWTAQSLVQCPKVARVFVALISSLSNGCYPTSGKIKTGSRAFPFSSLCVW
jgi:hypothetical protein